MRSSRESDSVTGSLILMGAAYVVPPSCDSAAGPEPAARADRPPAGPGRGAGGGRSGTGAGPVIRTPPGPV